MSLGESKPERIWLIGGHADLTDIVWVPSMGNRWHVPVPREPKYHRYTELLKDMGELDVHTYILCVIPFHVMPGDVPMYRKFFVYEEESYFDAKQQCVQMMSLGM